MKIPKDVQEILNKFLSPIDQDVYKEIFSPFFDEAGNLFLSLGSGDDRYLEWDADDIWSETDNEVLMVAHEILNEE